MEYPSIRFFAFTYGTRVSEVTQTNSHRNGSVRNYLLSVLSLEFKLQENRGRVYLLYSWFHTTGLAPDSQLVLNKRLWNECKCDIIHGKPCHRCHVYLEPGLSFLLHPKASGLSHSESKRWRVYCILLGELENEITQYTEKLVENSYSTFLFFPLRFPLSFLSSPWPSKQPAQLHRPFTFTSLILLCWWGSISILFLM